MSRALHDDIQILLASAEPEELLHGLDLVRQEISRRGANEARQLLEVVSALFSIDPLDQPELAPILEQAISVSVGFGGWVVPVLIQNLDSEDIKAQIAISDSISRIGADAIEPLIAEYYTSTDPARRSFVLQTLGKIKSSELLKAARLAVEACQSADLELRDTGTRAVGEFAECISPSDLPENLRGTFVEQLHKNLADEDPGIRATAVQSLGKLARYGQLNCQERVRLRELCQLVLGTDEHYEWDRAYIVRRQAEEALLYTQ